LGALRPREQHRLKHKVKTLAEVLQRASANVEGATDTSCSGILTCEDLATPASGHA